MRRKLSTDSRLVLGATLAVLAIVVIGAFFAPAREDSDPTPSTYNSGAGGAKAAFLLLAQLGYRTGRWEKSANDLSIVDAPHTTLVLASPAVDDFRRQRAAFADFLNRGGRILATGPVSASLLPDAHIAAPSHIYTALCYTTPQGLGPLARAGRIATPVPIRWSSEDTAASPSLHVDQACGDDAVVVHYASGKGEVIWWSAPAPLTNRGLKSDPSLRLLLASVGGPNRLILFDEYIHGAREDLWAAAAGTPVTALGWQLAGVAVLLVLSFGRRNGPLRALVQTPRTSPLEFAESMGALYRKAGAVSVATGCAERRLHRFLEHEGGIPRQTLRSTPEAIAAAVAERFRYTDPAFLTDLNAARQSEHTRLSPRSALALIQRIDRHIANLAGPRPH